MNLLGIDTSTNAQVLGLMLGDTLLDRTTDVGREHSQRILPAILDLLREAGISAGELDGIVFGQGPGSFTGLRIGVGVVQGLGYGLSIPVVPVSTLAVLAQAEYRASGAERIVVAVHARADEVFFGSYVIEQGLAQLIGTEGVHRAADVPVQPFDDCIGVGSGWQMQTELERALGVSARDTHLDAIPSAEDLLVIGTARFRVGQVVDAIDAKPEYLREEVASVPSRSTRSAPSTGEAP